MSCLRSSLFQRATEGPCILWSFIRCCTRSDNRTKLGQPGWPCGVISSSRVLKLILRHRWSQRGLPPFNLSHSTATFQRKAQISPIFPSGFFPCVVISSIFISNSNCPALSGHRRPLQREPSLGSCHDRGSRLPRELFPRRWCHFPHHFLNFLT